MERQCELRWCASEYRDNSFVLVNENIEDACFKTTICSTCANALRIVEGMDLPIYSDVRRILEAEKSKRVTNPTKASHG